MYAIVGIACDAEGTAAVEEELALAVEGSFLVAARAVGQRVCRPFGQDDKGTLAAQQVQCCRVGVGDMYTVETHSVLLVA